MACALRSFILQNPVPNKMISYERDPQQTIPESSVKIIGLGGAGANMLDRAALDGMTGAEMLCINTDMRTLSSSVAGEKIQIGKNLTKGLGAGGDPELGLKAAQESELEIRDTLRGRNMIFVCVGLGGGHWIRCLPTNHTYRSRGRRICRGLRNHALRI